MPSHFCLVVLIMELSFFHIFDIEGSLNEICNSNISLCPCREMDPMTHGTLNLDHYSICTYEKLTILLIKCVVLS